MGRWEPVNRDGLSSLSRSLSLSVLLLCDSAINSDSQVIFFLYN